jgi:hypothetical protein
LRIENFELRKLCVFAAFYECVKPRSAPEFSILHSKLSISRREKMSLRNVMKKAAGLLVEMPEDEAFPPATSGPAAEKNDKSDAARPAPDIDELLAVVRGPNAPKSGATAPGASPKAVPATQVAQSGGGPGLEQIKSAAAGAATPGATVNASVGPDGKIKVTAIYEAAGVPPTPFSAEQALEVIAALPPELPIEVKRQTVKATLNAIGKTLGATPQTIVADATRKAAALDAYFESFTKKSGEFTQKVEADIAALEKQIEEKRKAIETAKRRVEELGKFCDAEAEKLDDVLEFFSLDVGPSKYAPTNEELKMKN